MSNFSTDGKILGLVPINQYVKIAYLAVLTASGLSVVASILGLVGLSLGLGGLASVIGLIGLAMGLAGYFLFKEEFVPLDQSHLMYLSVLFFVFFLLGLVISSLLGGSLAGIIMLVVAIVELVLFFTGFNSWKHGRSITPDNISGEIQSALKMS